MSHDVFISHSRTDAAVAEAACAALEQAGVSCWMAPRDIQPGQTWSGAIVDAIGACRVLIVVLSSRANASTEIAREVELASHRKKRIVTWRIEAVTPSGPLEYFLASAQWLDGLRRPLAPGLAKLVEAITLILGRPEARLEAAPAPSAPVFVEVDPDDFGAPTGRVGGFIHRLMKDR